MGAHAHDCIAVVDERVVEQTAFWLAAFEECLAKTVNQTRQLFVPVELSMSDDSAGKRVEVRWHAGPLEHVEIWQRSKLAELAPLAKLQENIDFSKRNKKPSTKRGVTFESSKRYREHLLSEVEGESVLSSASDYLSEPDFQLLMETTLDRKFASEELRFLSEFFLTFCPFRKQLLSTLIHQYVAAKGKSLHLRSYLDHIRISIFKSRR